MQVHRIKNKSCTMPFKVSTRLDDIYFEETFDTELEALERAKTWTKANLGEVVIVHEGKTYTLHDFEIGFADHPGSSV
jgi:hypothetical protein